MSRHRARSAAVLALWMVTTPVLAQDVLEAQQGEPPDRIDILVRPNSIEGPLEDCSDEQEAASISGEIVVCRRRRDDSDLRYSSDDAAERRYAEATMNRGNPRAPDFIASCQDQGWPVGCFRIGKVPPPVYYIDVEGLPEAPPGSDADRIAQGLAPRGDDLGSQTPGSIQQKELGLPPVPDAPISPSELASPEAEPSD